MTAIYTRVSTQEQANNYSIDEQTERMIAYCNAMNWSYSVYTDAGFSGSNTNRPALQNLVEGVKTGKIQRVLVYKLDRLSRSQKDVLYLIEDVFLKYGCEFVSISENFSTDTPLGKAMIGILAVFAQLEREQIKERMTMGKEARLREGKWIGSVSPFGYSYDKQTGELSVDENESELVAEMFKQFTEGKPLRTMMDDFNAQGFRLRNNPWSLWSIRYMLQNRTYCGKVKLHEEWIEGQHEAIITEETFEKAQEILDENRKRFDEIGIRGGPSHYSTYLGGLLFCGCCGNKYGKRASGSGKTRHSTYCCYSRMKKVQTMIKDPNCKNKIYRVEELDKIIFDEIRKLKYQYKPKPEEKKEKSRLLQTELESCENQISRIVDLYSLGKIPFAQLDKKLNALNEQKEQLERELKNQKPKTKDPKPLIDTFGKVLDTGDFVSIRMIIEALIDKIVITGEDLDIYWLI